MTATEITLGQLESHLWEAANILRGPVDAADIKTYVFPLLFFKRIACKAFWSLQWQGVDAKLPNSTSSENYATMRLP